MLSPPILAIHIAGDLYEGLYVRNDLIFAKRSNI